MIHRSLLLILLLSILSASADEVETLTLPMDVPASPEGATSTPPSLDNELTLAPEIPNSESNSQGQTAAPTPPAADPTADFDAMPQALEPLPATEPSDEDVPRVVENVAPPVQAHESHDYVASSESSTRRFIPGQPLYQRTHPSWGFEMSTSLRPLGSNPEIGDIATADMKAISFSLDYQPRMFRSIGVLGFGASVNLYPGDTQRFFAAWSAGAQLRYQARFFREQILVPVVGYAVENLFLRGGGASATSIIQGPFFGGMVLLNSFEPSQAGEAWVNFGIVRSYLVAEFRNFSGSGTGISISGSSFYFGIRLEY